MRLMGVILFLLCGVLTTPASFAQSNPRFVPLPPAMGALYLPDGNPQPRVGVILMHRTANYMSHPACTELSARGFAVLCMNPRFVNNEVQVNWDRIALDVKAGVEFMRRQPGIEKVVLFGHSGGGPTMSFYQAVAENGVAYCQDPARIAPCADDLRGLPRADGIIFVDAHPGQPVMVMRALVPAVRSEENPPDRQLSPELDPLLPANGYNPRGNSRYSEDFVRRYIEGQARRMDAIRDEALGRWERVRSGTYPYPDNDIVVIPRAGNPGAGPAGSIYISQFDPSMDAFNTTRQPRKLLRNDGSIAVQPIRSVIVPDQSIAQSALTFDFGTKILSLRAFLTANAVRATDSAEGIDHCSSNNSTICAVQAIAVPVIFVGAGGFVFIRDNEIAFEHARSSDKDLIYIEGSNHGLGPCTPCETTPGQYANVTRNLFDHLRDWINARF